MRFTRPGPKARVTACEATLGPPGGGRCDVIAPAAVAQPSSTLRDLAADRREAVDRRALERLPRPQHGRGEVRVVRRVREVLGLECEPVALAVAVAAEAVERPVEEVPGVELDAGLRRRDRQLPAAGWIAKPRRDDHVRIARAAVEHPVVVV